MSKESPNSKIIMNWNQHNKGLGLVKQSQLGGWDGKGNLSVVAVGGSWDLGQLGSWEREPELPC